MDNGIINLNVGGSIYTTSRATLTKYPDSMLGAMFSNRVPVKLDDNGRVFIDCDGQMFRYVLNFLRYGELSLPERFSQYDLLQVEADYYQIEPLKEAVRIKTQPEATEEKVVLQEKLHKAQIWVIHHQRYDAYSLCGNIYSLSKVYKLPLCLMCSLFDEDIQIRLKLLKTQDPEALDSIFLGPVEDEYVTIDEALTGKGWVYNKDLSYSMQYGNTPPDFDELEKYTFSHWSLTPEAQLMLKHK